MEALFSCITDPKPKKKAVTGARFDPEPAAANAENYGTAKSKAWNRNNNSQFFTPDHKMEAHEATMDDIRVVRTAVGLRESHDAQSQARSKSMFSWADSNQRHKESANRSRSHCYHPAEIEWTEQEVKQARTFAVRHINLGRNSYGVDEPKGLQGLGEKSAFFQLNQASGDHQQAPALCGPSCQKDHTHDFEYDFTKNY